MPRTRLFDPVRLRRIHRQVRRVCGPLDPPGGDREPIVLCLVRNGEVWMREFIDHHLARGFAHLIFLDNGSTDATHEIARQSPRVTLFETALSFRRFKTLLRRYLIERFGRNRWTLSADIDELWDYPHSDRVALPEFLGHLRANGDTAVVAHMLDLFAARLPREPTPLTRYRNYCLASVARDALDIARGFRSCGFSAQREGCAQHGFLRGGIRSQIFGLDELWLTKMPLLFYEEGLDPFVHQHFSNGARIADTSSVLLHYKLVHGFHDQVEDAVRRRQYFGRSREYRRYRDVLAQRPRLPLRTATTRTLRSVDQLLAEGFLVTSAGYAALADSKSMR